MATSRILNLALSCLSGGLFGLRHPLETKRQVFLVADALHADARRHVDGHRGLQVGGDLLLVGEGIEHQHPEGRFPLGQLQARRSALCLSHAASCNAISGLMPALPLMIREKSTRVTPG